MEQLTLFGPDSVLVRTLPKLIRTYEEETHFLGRVPSCDGTAGIVAFKLMAGFHKRGDRCAKRRKGARGNEPARFPETVRRPPERIVRRQQQKMLRKLIEWKTERYAKRNQSALRIQIASMINAACAVRERFILSNIQTAVIMRRGFETFLTADLLGIENPQSVVAAVCLRDMRSYEEFRRVQSDNVLRGTALDELTLNQLANEVTGALLRQIRKAA